MLVSKEGMIGDVEIGRVFERGGMVDAKLWFPKFEAEALRPHEHWLCPDHYDAAAHQFPLPVQSFVLRTDKHTIVVDTCIGNDKERGGIEGMHMLNEPYLARLAALGIRPEEVDFVMCTHLHVDHIGWNTRLDNGRWVPTFPNARYVFSKAEYEAVLEEAGRPDVSDIAYCSFNDSVLPIVEANMQHFVDGDDEMLGLLRFRPAPGHSPGNMRIELKSRGELGIFAGDILHSPIQIPCWEWSSIVCWDPDMAAAARRTLLEDCVETGALLLPGHFAAPHVARIEERDGCFTAKFGW